MKKETPKTPCNFTPFIHETVRQIANAVLPEINNPKFNEDELLEDVAKAHGWAVSNAVDDFIKSRKKMRDAISECAVFVKEESQPKLFN